MQYEVTDGVHAREKKGFKKKRSAYCKYACVQYVFLFMDCACEKEQRHMQTHPVPTHFLCALVYIKKQPRRRSKSRISRVDLHLTVSYSVSSSSPNRIPPCFPQTCSFAVIWRLWPWELPGSALITIFVRFHECDQWRYETGPELTALCASWSISSCHSSWEFDSFPVSSYLEVAELHYNKGNFWFAQVFIFSASDSLKVQKNVWVTIYSLPKIAIFF